MAIFTNDSKHSTTFANDSKNTTSFANDSISFIPALFDLAQFDVSQFDALNIWTNDSQEQTS